MPDLIQETIYTIDRFSKKGWGRTAQGLDIFGALPGEEVSALKRGRKALLKQIITPSQERVEPRCPHAMQCGGCAFQHFDYQAQLRLKEERVLEALSEAIERCEPVIHPIIGCENPWRYRNKMEFSFSQNKEGDRFLGLMLAGSRGRVENLQECHLASPWMMEALESARHWWEKSGLSAYRHSANTGHLRTLTLREAMQGSGRLAMITVSGNPDFALKASHVNGFIAAMKGIADSIFLEVHQIAKGRPTQFFEMHLAGPAHITEKLFDYEFKVSPTSFFQPNTKQAEILYTRALEMLGESDTLFDLYCGTGTTSIVASAQAKKVIGIELNPQAVFDAQSNVEHNGKTNVEIIRGDVGAVLEKMEAKADGVLVDPPRSGLDNKALGHLLKLGAEKILYISCNPKTQGENLLPLIDAGYRLVEVQPVDQFPHTVHIENLCLLKRG
jgi:23S rRNA (uracil1939-C5)-methyltransferase